MKIKGKYIERSTYIWIYSAVIIFVCGFLKWYLAIISLAAIGAILYCTFKQQKDTEFSVSKGMLIAGGIVIVLWMIYCGQCGIMFQPADWNGRNAQLNDLVSLSWPIYYSDGSAFTYYIGHFLVPALTGKIFGLGAARIALMLYTSIGVYIIWLYLVKLTKADNVKRQIIVLFLLIFFSQLDNLHTMVSRMFNNAFNISAQPIIFGFTNNSSSFACVFNQITCAFIVLCVFFDDDTRIENLAVLGVPMLLFSPFMLCGIFVIAAAGAVKQLVMCKNDMKGFFRQLLSVQNLCALLVIFPIIMLYLSGNVFSEKPDAMSFAFVSYSGRASVYIIFVLVEFLLYSILLYPSVKKNIYFYIANLILIALPFVTMGKYNDLVTRVSSVGLFVLMLISLQVLFEKPVTKQLRTRKIILCLLIIWAALPKMNEYALYTKDFVSGISNGSYTQTWLDEFKTYERLAERISGDDLKYGYYTFNAKEHFFFKYMARK